MSSYRLLRNNKESGPFSQEQIIALGFKPYDLIWIEGKSAGWRYPGEIPELKAYAPMVEEQPYDRFFKKPVVPARGTPLPETVLAADVHHDTYETVVPGPQRPAYTPASLQVVGKHIHVTLPSGNTLNVTTVSNRREPVADIPVQYERALEEKKPSFAESIARVPLTPVNETMVAATSVHTTRADDHEAVSYYPAQQPASSYSWTTLVGLITGIATLVGLGVMIGLSINRAKPEQARIDTLAETQQVATTTPVSTDPVNNNNTTSQPLSNNLPAVNTVAGTQPPVSQPTETQPVADHKDATNARTKSAIAKKDINTLPAKPVDKPVAATNPAAKDPVIVHPAPAEAVPAVNLEKQVNVVTSGYKVGAFGGISNLQCTLVNDSRYALETVEVEVQYIQANDKVYKTEMLSFRDVAAGAQMTITAPKSSRGIKIISRIVKINSKEPGLAGITVKS